MSRTKKLMFVILALAMVYLASGVIMTATAASPYMNVKFLRVLVNTIIDGDLTVGDDATITDDLTVSGDLAVAGASGLTGALTVDLINEATANNGVVVETVTHLDGGVSATAPITTTSTISATGNIRTPAALVADTVSEFTSGNGVAVDSVLLKDGGADLTGDDLTFENDEYITNDQNGYLVYGISANREFTFSSTSLELFANELFLDADADTSLHSDVDDQIDFTLGGDVDAVFAANLFQLSSGTVFELDTMNEETANNGIVAEGVTFIDGGITVTANILLTGDFELDGVIRDTSGAVTIEKAAFIDGTADDVQLRVQASGVGQASHVIVIEDEDGNDGFRVDRIGDTWISGTVTIVNGDLDVDAGDAQFDGAVTVTFGSVLYASDIVEASSDEGVNIESISVVDGALTVDDITISNFINYTPQTPIVIADDGWLTPTGTFQGIAAAGSIGFSRIYTTGFTDGDILILYNTIAQTIVITDENDTNLNTDRTLGIGDILTLIFTNTAWWETGYTDN